MDRIRLAIAEDHVKFRNALVDCVSVEEDFQIVLLAENGKDLLDQLKKVTPDVILLDLRMPVMDGYEAARIILKQNPEAKIIAWTLYEQIEEVVAMYKIGIRSFIGKDEKDVFSAIKIVASGAYYFPHQIGKLIERHLNKSKANCPIELDQFETHLLRAIVRGQSSVQIGANICRSPRTVEDYRNKLYEKCCVNNKEQLIAFAVKWQLVDVSSF